MSEFKPNFQQDPRDIAKDYEKWEAEQHYMEPTPTKPEEISKSMVRRGMLNPRTGMLTGNSKQSKILANNVAGYSEQGKRNYERIFGHA